MQLERSPERAPVFVMEDDEAAERGIEPAGWAAVGAGVLLAGLTELWPLLRVLVGHFVVLLHELGHALAGWVLGYPSLPAFDFRYGGGVTLHQDRMPLLVVGVYALLLFLAWLFRSNRVSLAATLAAIVVYTGLVFTRAGEAAIIAMGHGGELFFAGLFLHRALSGRACHHAAERTAYAWIGFHVVFHDMRFSWGLLTNAFQREMYGEAKGGGHWMDFSRLADEFFGVPLELVAGAFLLLCLLPPAVALAASWLRPELAELRERLGAL